jgi:site-specific DNA recombinase
MKRPQYVFRPNLNEPQHRRAWALLQQVPPAKRKEFLVQSILAAEQTDRLEKSIRKVVREELQAVNITNAVPSSLSENLQKSKRASVEKKIKTAQHALERFEGEILKCLDGTSNFTEDMIAKQIRRYQQELDDAKAEYAALQNARLNEAAEIRKLRTYYDEFRGWAEEFDAAPLEIKRMILSQLIERVEVGRKYQVTIKLNMEYQQFLEITEEQKLIPLISA